MIDRRGVLFAGLAALAAGLSRPWYVWAQQSSVVKTGLLQFEDGVSWEAVSPAWRAQRSLWLGDVHDARTATELAQQLLRLEATMGWSAVNDSWHQRRPGWLAEVAAVRTDAQFARLLLELEAVTRWAAVRPVWRQRRTAWVTALRAVP